MTWPLLPSSDRSCSNAAASNHRKHQMGSPPDIQQEAMTMAQRDDDGSTEIE
jgi:hypothetical protein